MQYKNFVLFIIFLMSGYIYGQNELRLVPSNGQPETELFTQIIADTTANHGIPADRVYVLDGEGIYLCQQQFYLDSVYTLRFKSSNDKKAIIYLFPSGTGSSPQNPPGNFIRSRGGAIYMTNIALTGIFEPDPDAINNIQGAQLRVDDEGASVVLDNCVFSNTSGQVLRTEGATKLIKITNTIFTNLGALTTSNFGAGKGLDLRATSCDSLILINNTFTNYQDRVVRHYNTGGAFQTGNIGYTLIDHNTFYNGMGFHGLLSLGNVGKEVILTNNLFKDAFAAGEDSTDATRYEEWKNTGELYPSGGHRMMWIFTAPNDTTEWTVKNNYYAISAEGQAFFDAHTADPIVEGSPLSWHINSRLGADSVTAFTKIADPGFVNTQDLMVNLMEWYVSPTGGHKSKETGNFNVATDDMDRRPLDFWINELDASYSTSSLAYTGAQGYPAGDLNWFPEQKAAWMEDPTDVDVVETLPTEYSLSQNYPNPFNPSTVIEYYLPVESKIKLDVYDVLGSKVASLVNQNQTAGKYSVNFDASRLSSGIYFYQLTASSTVISKKMILIK